MGLSANNPPQKKRPPARKAKVGTKVTKSRDQLTLEEKLTTPAMLKLREQFKKKFKDHAIMGFDKPMKPVQVIPTGFRDLDLRCIGNGDPEKAGLFRGHIIEVYGPESGGKSTFLMGTVGNIQKQGYHCVWIDLERTMDYKYAERLGVDTSKWDYVIPADGDEAVEMAVMFINAGADFVVLDSIGMLDPKADIDKELKEDPKMAGPVHLMKKCLQKTSAPLFNNQSIFVVVNHIRAKINASRYEDPEQTTGGHRLRHQFVLRLRVAKGNKIKKGETILGVEMKIQVKKNKLGQPWLKTEIPLMFSEGIPAALMLFEEAVNLKVIEQHGAYYSYAEETIGQGKDNARKYLEENPDVMALIAQEVEEKIYGIKQEQLAEEPSEEEMVEFSIDDGEEFSLES